MYSISAMDPIRTSRPEKNRLISVTLPCQYLLNGCEGDWKILQSKQLVELGRVNSERTLLDRGTTLLGASTCWAWHDLVGKSKWKLSVHC